jgi:hypothetical protein
MASSVEELSRDGVDHFNGFFKEDNRATIAEVIKMATLFSSSLVSLEEVSKEELQAVLHFLKG